MAGNFYPAPRVFNKHRKLSCVIQINHAAPITPYFRRRVDTIPMALVPLLCLSILASPLSATTVQRFDLADLVTRADRIVVGICNSAEPS